MVRILAGPEVRGLSVLSGGADGSFGQMPLASCRERAALQSRTVTTVRIAAQATAKRMPGERRLSI
jgi:hypothetical protein